MQYTINTRIATPDCRVVPALGDEFHFHLQTSPVLQCRFIGNQVEQMTGYAPEDFYRDPFLMVSIERPPNDHLAGEWMTCGRQVTQKIKWRCKDGSEIWLDVSATVFFDAAAESTICFGKAQIAAAYANDLRARTFLDVCDSLILDSASATQTAGALAKSLTRAYADLCIVDIDNLPGKRQIIAVEARSVDRPGDRKLIRRAVENPQARPCHVKNVITSRETLQRTSMSSADIAFFWQSIAVRKALGRLPLHSMLVVPLMAEDRVLGALSLMFAQDNELFTFDPVVDAAFAEKVAHYAATRLTSVAFSRHHAHMLRRNRKLLSSIAHDLRAPLTGGLLNAELISFSTGHKSDDDAIRRPLERIQSALESMNVMVQELCDFAWQSDGRTRLSVHPTAPAALLHAAYDAFETQVSRQGISLGVVDAAPEQSVEVNREKILRVFGNLINNAQRVSAPGGCIEIGARRCPDAICFWVKDWGPGIHKAHLASLFEPYWQANPHTADGPGLGLANVKMLVEAHGGRVWVESEIGIGSTFYFELPMTHACKRVADACS